MTSQPPLKRASYVLHVVTVAALTRHSSNTPSLEALPLVRLLDEVLDLFEREPRFQHFVLGGESILLEDYLSVRPESFEKIEQLVQDGRLLVGPWYIQTDPMTVSVESQIRNLMIGLRTARVFGPPMRVGYTPCASGLLPALPQILKGFGIEVALSPRLNDTDPLEHLWEGDDGSRILLADLPDGITTQSHSLIDRRAAAAPYSESGHILLIFNWNQTESHQERLDWLYSLPAAQRTLHDSVFHSHPAAYAKAFQTYASGNPPSIIRTPAQTSETLQFDKTLEHVIGCQLEPFAAWVENLRVQAETPHLRHPQQVVQKLWRSYLELLGPTVPNEYNNEVNLQKQSALVRTASELARLAQMSLAAQVNTALLTSHGAEDEVILVVFNPNRDATLVAVLAKFMVADQVAIATHDAVVPAFGYTTLLAHYTDQTHLNVEPAADSVARHPLVTYIETPHEGDLPLSWGVISVLERDFYLSAVKLPEDADRVGIVVRGWNKGSAELWVTLTPWRAFSVVEVMTMDESPTGGKLAPESDGAVRFRAAPHRILTFWFHD